MFNFTKKNELYYIQEILNMYSWCRREQPSEEKYLKNIKDAILSINTKKINSEYISKVQTDIKNLDLKDSIDRYSMKKILTDWEKYRAQLKENQ